ncbi:c-type cytochrome [Aquamicrobium zhengzhouense]|uniref:Cytochrome c domain-containing protein n=1 Tax=Aquamicrobium zhengzhouense TaxID=2781738 RepID=A0ABS0S9Z0_9HYPH|nr:hypothetical protein [Aquamicrobium zhengzhouense]MBI1619511.1 hypothetical protein [Aquamicrobium zhengzhouense]
MKLAFHAVLALAALNSPVLAVADPSSIQRVGEAREVILGIDADRAYGEYLAGDCVACHRLSGEPAGIPIIHGQPVSDLITALLEYKLGVRTNEVMSVRTARLGDQEIAALAAHFAAQTK